MQAFLPWLIGALATLTFVVLVAGLVNMIRSSGSPIRANRLMRWRVGLQALAILVLLVLMLLAG